ncbi:PTS fructose transporter subunit IIA, partial [Enterococcus faecium]
MGKQLVLVSHGLFCEELKKSTEMIMGPQESIHTVSLLPAESAEDFRAKFEAVIADLDDFVVLADLMGGTPCNVVSRMILEGQAIELYAGMNMPMVIDFINSELIGTELALVE